MLTAVPVLLYNLFLVLYAAALRVAALFHPKAAKWVAGRRQWRRRLAEAMAPLPAKQRVWMHCASLGEFEQGRPLLEGLKAAYPGCIVILSFFSPSGYEIRKDYELADYVCYLPLDGRRNAADFIDAVRPSLAVFVKYEFWYYYLTTLQQRQLPAISISAAFRKEQPFFAGYGGFFRRMLVAFRYLFVQDETSAELLEEAGFQHQVRLAGDTRYDRVSAIAAAAADIPLVAEFKSHHPLLIAGSTWPADEKLLKESYTALPDDWKLIIAPHEIGGAHLRQLQQQWGSEAILYSQAAQQGLPVGKRVLIIDNIGMLSALYRYGDIAYVGGGLGKSGIHNTLEPAVFGLPVLFGPVYEKFVEAVQLVRQQYAFPVADAAACRQTLHQLSGDDAARQQLHRDLLQFVRRQTGATERILELIRSEGWLPS